MKRSVAFSAAFATATFVLVAGALADCKDNEYRGLFNGCYPKLNVQIGVSAPRPVAAPVMAPSEPGKSKPAEVWVVPGHGPGVMVTPGRPAGCNAENRQ